MGALVCSYLVNALLWVAVTQAFGGGWLALRARPGSSPVEFGAPGPLMAER